VALRQSSERLQKKKNRWKDPKSLSAYHVEAASIVADEIDLFAGKFSHPPISITACSRAPRGVIFSAALDRRFTRLFAGRPEVAVADWPIRRGGRPTPAPPSRVQALHELFNQPDTYCDRVGQRLGLSREEVRNLHMSCSFRLALACTRLSICPGGLGQLGLKAFPSECVGKLLTLAVASADRGRSE